MQVWLVHSCFKSIMVPDQETPREWVLSQYVSLDKITLNSMGFLYENK